MHEGLAAQSRARKR